MIDSSNLSWWAKTQVSDLIFPLIQKTYLASRNLPSTILLDCSFVLLPTSCQTLDCYYCCYWNKFLFSNTPDKNSGSCFELFPILAALAFYDILPRPYSPNIWPLFPLLFFFFFLNNPVLISFPFFSSTGHLHTVFLFIFSLGDLSKFTFSNHPYVEGGQ